MFGCRPHWNHDRHAAGRFGDGEGFGRHGGGRWRGGGGGDMFRFGRMVAQGDLKLITLALIAEQPRHGYEIIKLIEEKTGGWYSPSPGTVYPTLTFLEEAGYVAAEVEGAKKRYSITPEGEAYLADNRDFADSILSRLSEIGQKMSRFKSWVGRGEEERRRGAELPRLVEAAFENLREAVQDRLGRDPSGELRLVEILSRTAREIRED